MRREGNRLLVEGDITSNTVPALLETGAAHVREGAEVVDFAAAGEIDSTAVALSLHLMREAKSQRRTLTFVNFPESLSNLVQMYGLSELLAESA